MVRSYVRRPVLFGPAEIDTMAPTLSFVELLEARLRENAPRQKGERTREQLKIATAKMLGEKGYHGLRVTDITECAGIAEGSFYVYFSDIKDASLTVLTALLEEFADRAAASETPRTRFEAIQAANRRWLALCRANAGLIRCVFQLGDEEPDFAELVQRTNRSWYERISRSVLKRRRDLGREPVLLVVYFLGGMMDEIVRKLIVYPDPEFHNVLKSLRANDEAVADAASLIWVRVLDPDEPVPDTLSAAAKKVANWMRG